MLFCPAALPLKTSYQQPWSCSSSPYRKSIKMKPYVSNLLSAPTSATTPTNREANSRSKQPLSAAQCSASSSSSRLRRVFHCLSSAQGYLADQSDSPVDAALAGKPHCPNPHSAPKGDERQGAPSGDELQGAPSGATWTQDPAQSLRFLCSDVAVSRAKALCHLYPDIAISVVSVRCASLGTWIAVDE